MKYKIILLMLLFLLPSVFATQQVIRISTNVTLVTWLDSTDNRSVFANLTIRTPQDTIIRENIQVLDEKYDFLKIEEISCEYTDEWKRWNETINKYERCYYDDIKGQWVDCNAAYRECTAGKGAQTEAKDTCDTELGECNNNLTARMGERDSYYTQLEGCKVERDGYKVEKEDCKSNQWKYIIGTLVAIGIIYLIWRKKYPRSQAEKEGRTPHHGPGNIPESFRDKIKELDEKFKGKEKEDG